MICKNCSSSITDDSIFCPNCGAKAEETATAETPIIIDVQNEQVEVSQEQEQPQVQVHQEQPQPQAQEQPQAQRPQTTYVSLVEEQKTQQIPEEYTPLSPWAYFGYTLLFAVPIVGFILLIIFSFNGSNINRRNFARSYWCMLLIFGILYLIFFVFTFMLVMVQRM